MKFGGAVNKKFYYKNEKELLEDKNRLKIWERYRPKFEELLKELYYHYEVKDFYFVNEFTEKKIHFPDKVEILFEISKEDFEDLVDSHLLDQYNAGAQYYCKVGDNVFTLEENWEEREDCLNRIFMKECYA